jgi:hypothetical protein
MPTHPSVLTYSCIDLVSFLGIFVHIPEILSEVVESFLGVDVIKGIPRNINMIRVQ